MPTIFKSCIAKRTRLQQQQQLLSQGFNGTNAEICGSSRVQSRKRNREIGFSKRDYEQGCDEVIDIDDYGIKKKKKKASRTFDGNGSSSMGRRLDQPIRIDDSDEEQDYENGSGCSSRSKVRLKKSIELDESSLDESEEEESDAEESDGEEEIGDIEFPKIATESNGYGSASSFKTGTHTYFVYSSDDSDSDDTIVVLDEEEDDDEDFQTFCKDHDRKLNDMNTCFYDQSTEDYEEEPSSSSESESENSENWDFLLNKRLHEHTSNTDTGLHQSTEHNEPSTSIQSESESSHGSDSLPSTEKSNQQPTKNMKEKKAITKRTDKKPTDCSSDTDTNGKTSEEHIANGVKHRERKIRRVPREEKGGSVDAILDSIVVNGDVHGKEGDDDDDNSVRVLPLRFRFDDSDDESSRETMIQTCNVENRDTDGSDGKNDADIKLTPSELCQRGEHEDIYLEEETGLRCRLCGAVILEIRYVIPKLATYAPDKSKRSHLSSEQQLCSSENLNYEASDWNPKSMQKSRGGCRSGSEDIERLKTIISPFVHVHKGHILESKLPGLKQSVVLLNPPPFQKHFIENLGSYSNTFEYECKVALLSVHPSLLLRCSLSEEEEKLTDKKELEKVRLRPDLGVKTRFVMELIRLSISLDEKVLIFSQYIQPLELLKDQIALSFDWDDGREIMMIQGKIHQKVRQTIINGFNDSNSEIKVLLASTKCCSEGIHLTGASRVVLLDVVWNPSVERQAISRAYRLGQKKMVYTYHLMTAGTTEEEKYDRQVEKGRLAELVFSSSAMVGDRKGGGGGGVWR
ncbi:hypothetical protein OSB04_008610 [Centaurea solstitialis]|uniref:Helicase C-terminal domain-containing protein n=1 Tax=Centaurea solstitialis TaxID=347529 RepID=A0AA38WRI7_9ASTR|nr:hypothetical protein OSB04_008610 [Centaurea solstitialis]